MYIHELRAPCFEMFSTCNGVALGGTLCSSTCAPPLLPRVQMLHVTLQQRLAL